MLWIEEDASTTSLNLSANASIAQESTISIARFKMTTYFDGTPYLKLEPQPSSSYEGSNHLFDP